MQEKQRKEVCLQYKCALESSSISKQRYYVLVDKAFLLVFFSLF